MKLLVLLAITTTARAAPSRFAIVIGNNRPESGRDVTLRYADDDAAATHRLLVEAGVNSTLLARFDDDTARQAAGLPLAPTAPPTWEALGRALDRARSSLGGDGELFLFYSGHGDVAHGEGYVMLEDRRLTRSMLYQLLRRSGARRHHVIVDACKSYFLAFEKGPGGERSAYAHAFDDAQVPAELGNTGFVLSTSSDRESHEWERFGGGVFSHEVRSALRGAADLDADGHISYAELGAFLATANEAISNPRFRPDFAVRPPGRAIDAELLAWPNPASLTIQSAVGHVFVEGAGGERIVDGHAAPGQQLAVWLPPGRPLFLHRGDDDAEYAIVETPVRFADLQPSPPRAVSRGALHLAFERLFVEPFGPAKLAAFAARFAEGERLVVTVRRREQQRRVTRRALAWTSAALFTVGLALSAAAIERYATGRDASQLERVKINNTLGALNPALGVTLTAATGFGAAWLGLTLKWR